MKELTLEVIEKFEDGTYWITGRCCKDDINVNDILWHENDPNIKVQVVKIEVYRKKYSTLHTGYVGGVVVKLLRGNELKIGGCLVSI